MRLKKRLVPVYALHSNSIYLKFSGCRIPARLPLATRLSVRAAIKAAPTPLPSSAARISTGSSSWGSDFSGQSRISRRAWAPRALKWGYLLKTEPSAPTWQGCRFFLVQIAATPQADRRAARVPTNSAVRRMSSSSGRVQVSWSFSLNRSAVSCKFSKGSLDIISITVLQINENVGKDQLFNRR